MQQRVALEDVVKRQTHSEYGLFYEMYQDLAEYAETIDSTSSDPNDKLLLMTYAYARRSASAGLYLQGLMDTAGWKYTCEIFKTFQAASGHTKIFQEKATELSVQYMLSYSPFLTRENISILMNIARSVDRVPSDDGIIVSCETVFGMVKHVAATINH